VPEYDRDFRQRAGRGHGERFARSILTPGLDGFICQPVDVEAYATVLARLIADPGLRHTIGAAARRTSLTYSWDAASRSVESAYRGVLARAAINASSTSRRRSLPK
jgi:glycosyltransferase involved in cell wall biosynthesis